MYEIHCVKWTGCGCIYRGVVLTCSDKAKNKNCRPNNLIIEMWGHCDLECMEVFSILLSVGGIALRDGGINSGIL
jgi:hypothetical protein